MGDLLRAPEWYHFSIKNSNAVWKKSSLGSWKSCREGGGVLPYKRLIGTCRWMGSHFHDWSDYNGVAFSSDLLEWGRKFLDFGGK